MHVSGHLSPHYLLILLSNSRSFARTWWFSASRMADFGQTLLTTALTRSLHIAALAVSKNAESYTTAIASEGFSIAELSFSVFPRSQIRDATEQLIDGKR